MEVSHTVKYMDYIWVFILRSDVRVILPAQFPGAARSKSRATFKSRTGSLLNHQCLMIWATAHAEYIGAGAQLEPSAYFIHYILLGDPRGCDRAATATTSRRLPPPAPLSIPQSLESICQKKKKGKHWIILPPPPPLCCSPNKQDVNSVAHASAGPGNKRDRGQQDAESDPNIRALQVI